MRSPEHTPEQQSLNKDLIAFAILTERGLIPEEVSFEEWQAEKKGEYFMDGILGASSGSEMERAD